MADVFAKNVATSAEEAAKIVPRAECPTPIISRLPKVSSIWKPDNIDRRNNMKRFVFAVPAVMMLLSTFMVGA